MDRLSTVFAALADPTRRAILARLAQGDASVAELAAPFTMTQPAVSKHLKVLEQAGLITRNRVATARYSHLEAAPLKEAVDYMQRYRRFWDASLERLDALLGESAVGPTPPSAPPVHPTRDRPTTADRPPTHDQHPTRRTSS